ncbi:hypothetical protein Bca4012_027160 [Brassica carinata]
MDFSRRFCGLPLNQCVLFPIIHGFNDKGCLSSVLGGGDRRGMVASCGLRSLLSSANWSSERHNPVL